MKRAKKVLCLVLAVALTLSLMSVGVFAASDSDSNTTSVTQTGLISDLIGKLLSGTTDVDAGNANDNIHGIVTVMLDNILNNIASGTFTHGVVTVNTGDLFKDIASHSDYTHGIVTVEGNTTTINFGKLLTDVTSSDSTTKADAQSAFLAILEKLGVSAAQSKSVLADLVSGKLTNEGLATLVSALNAGKAVDVSGISAILGALNSAGYITTSALTEQLKALVNGTNTTKDDFTKVITGLITGSTADKSTLAGVIESLLGSANVSKTWLGTIADDVANNIAGMANTANSNFTSYLETLIKNGITGDNLASVINKAIVAGTYTNTEILNGLKDLIANGTMTQKTFKSVLETLLSKGFSGDDIASMVKAALLKGTVTTEGLATILNSLVTGGLADKGKVIDLISKLLPSGSATDNPLFKLFLTLAGTTAADIQAKLLKLLQGGNASSILSYLQSLFGTGNASTLLARLKALLTGAGFPTLDISSLLSKLASLLGLGGTNIDDENTALAGLLALNDTDHNLFVTGRTATTFAPYGSLTRAEVCVMLYALLTDDSIAKCGASASDASSFSDVPAGTWYSAAVNTLANGGAVAGYPNGTFKPFAPITRAEFATIMTAFYGVTEGATCSFSDVSAGAWYYSYVATASTNGWVTGYPNGTFRPLNNITRAEAVTVIDSVLARSCDLTFVANHIGAVKTFSDVTRGAWYYGYVMEAANGHNYTKASSGAETWTSLK